MNSNTVTRFKVISGLRNSLLYRIIGGLKNEEGYWKDFHN
jgi:hypothetical protein